MYLSISTIMIDRAVFLLTVPWRITGVIYPLFSMILIWKLVVIFSNMQQTGSLKLRGFQLIGLSTFLIIQNMSKFLVIYLSILIIRSNFRQGKKNRLTIFDGKRDASCIIVAAVSVLLGLTAQASTSEAWRENSEGFPGRAQLANMRLNGIGVVPPQFNNFRVDFGLNIFVDSKAPPFDGDSLAEWMKRLKIAERVQIHPNMLCTDGSLHRISWAIVPIGVYRPSCFRSIINLNKDWLLLQK